MVQQRALPYDWSVSEPSSAACRERDVSSKRLAMQNDRPAVTDYPTINVDTDKTPIDLLILK